MSPKLRVNKQKSEELQDSSSYLHSKTLLKDQLLQSSTSNSQNSILLPALKNLPHCSKSLDESIDQNWGTFFSWFYEQSVENTKSFISNLGNFLAINRLDIFKAYHLKNQFNLFEQLKSINSLWHIYQLDKGVNKANLAHKLQNLYNDGYLNTVQKLTLLNFLNDFKLYNDKKQEIQNTVKLIRGKKIDTQVILESQKQNEQPKERHASELVTISFNSIVGFSFQKKSVDKEWNDFISVLFKNPVNSNADFFPSLKYFLDYIYKQTPYNEIVKQKMIKLSFTLIAQKSQNESAFDFISLLNDLYYELPDNNYVYRLAFLKIWRSFYLGYTDVKEGKGELNIDSVLIW
jgi:hypothetical protein